MLSRMFRRFTFPPKARPAEPDAAPPRSEREAGWDLRGPNVLPAILGSSDPTIPRLFAPSVRAASRIALQAVLRSEGRPPRWSMGGFKAARAVCGEHHARAVDRIFAENALLERTVRAVAWAAGRSSRRAAFRCAIAAYRPDATLALRVARLRPAIVWWLAEQEIPHSIVGVARRVGSVLVESASPARSAAPTPGVFRSECRAIIERPDGRGAPVRVPIDASAAWIQAYSQGIGAAWVPVIPPAGIAGIEPDLVVSSVPSLAARNGIAVLRRSALGHALVVPGITLPNRPRRSVKPRRPEEAGTQLEDAPMEEARAKTVIHFPEEDSGADPAALGAVLVVANLSGRQVPRGREELERELSEIPAASLPELVRAAELRIQGTYAGLDGEPVSVSIPIEDESTFTPDGLTRGDPGLFRLYVASRTYEQLESHLRAHHRDTLTAEEIEHLQSTLRFLEESLRQEEES